MAILYVSHFLYEKNSDMTTASFDLSSDPLQTGVEINGQIAAEVIKALADAGGLEIEIVDVKKY